MNPRQLDSFILSRRKSDLDGIERAFPDHLKLRSISWLLRRGAPSTEGVVFTSASSTAVAAALEYAASRGWSRFMVRHDAPRGLPRPMQGGFLINLDEISHWLSRFTRGGVCMLLEPLDPLRNGYNVSCLFDIVSASLEIVGPGFDASDLQRGQIIPHERRSLNTATGELGPPMLCDEDTYFDAVDDRYRKVWWKFVKRESEPQKWTDPGDPALQAARRSVIEARGSPIPPTYVPMPEGLLAKYVRLARPLLAAWSKRRDCGSSVLAGSFVQDGSLRFWDVNVAARWTSAAEGNFTFEGPTH